MNHAKSLPYLLVLFLLVNLTIMRITEKNITIVYLIVFIISVIVFSALSTNNGFLFFLLLAISLGCYYTVRAFYENSPLMHQLSLIGSYTILLAGIALLWLIFHTARSIHMEHIQLQQEVRTLRKHEMNGYLLTSAEFLSRMTLLHTGMKRRNETGYLLIINLSQEKKYVREALFHTVSRIALQTIRAEYDLAGQMSKTTIVILLQHTNEQGAEIVMKRFEQKMEKELANYATLYKMNKMPLNETIYRQIIKGKFSE